MTEVDAALVRRKLARIVRNLEELKSVQNLALAEYVEDRFRQKGTERLLQETIEWAVDVNLHLLRAGGVHAPPDYFRSFIEVGVGHHPQPLAERLAPSTGLRDRLIHEYDAIDDQRVLDTLPKAIEEYREFVEAVHSWLKRHGV